MMCMYLLVVSFKDIVDVEHMDKKNCSSSPARPIDLVSKTQHWKRFICTTIEKMLSCKRL